MAARTKSTTKTVQPFVAPAAPETQGFGNWLAEFAGDAIETGADITAEIHGAINASSVVYNTRKTVSETRRTHRALERARIIAAQNGLPLQF